MQSSGNYFKGKCLLCGANTIFAQCSGGGEPRICDGCHEYAESIENGRFAVGDRLKVAIDKLSIDDNKTFPDDERVASWEEKMESIYFHK